MKKSSMTTKKLIALVILTVMVSSLLPSVAQAVVPSGIWVGGTQLLKSTYYINDEEGGIKTEGATEDNYNVYYDNDILNLRNVDITKNYMWENDKYKAAIFAQRDLEIKQMNTNTLRGIDGVDGDFGSYGIYLQGYNLRIVGTGSLTVTGGNNSNRSYGIQAETFTMELGSITANGGDFTNLGSYGIYAKTLHCKVATLRQTAALHHSSQAKASLWKQALL